MINKQPAAFLVSYIEKLISISIQSSSKLECDLSIFNTLLADFIETCELPKSSHATIFNLLLHKYSALFNYINQFHDFDPLFVHRTAFNTYIDIIEIQSATFLIYCYLILTNVTFNRYSGFHDLVTDVNCEILL